jgi:2'-5' RNA ligase superfamily
MTGAPIIVSALIGEPDFSYLDALRQFHFPAERNNLRAHLTMFHHLPPSIERELLGALRAETREAARKARLASVMNLGRGVAFRVESQGLADIRARLVDRFAPMLIPQDSNPWRAHVTVQNKADPAAAKALLAALQAEFAPRPLALKGLAAWWYRGGPWEKIAAYSFR